MSRRMTERELLERIADEYRHILGENLVGVYLHGSIAMGCFTWATGDIDFLVVVDAPLAQTEKEALVRVLLDMDGDAPPKGFEMSVVLRRDCRPFLHPMSFELHFANAHKTRAMADLPAYCRDMHGVDPDLAAHCTVIRSRGETLWGVPIADVFGEVPRAAYVDSLMYDIASAGEDIADNPVYVTLNLCRVLAYLTEGAVLSKQEGGEWGLKHLAEGYHPLLAAALDAYGGAAFPGGMPLDAFAAEMLARIRELA